MVDFILYDFVLLSLTSSILLIKLHQRLKSNNRKLNMKKMKNQ